LFCFLDNCHRPRLPQNVRGRRERREVPLQQGGRKDMRGAAVNNAVFLPSCFVRYSFFPVTTVPSFDSYCNPLIDICCCASWRDQVYQSSPTRSQALGESCGKSPRNRRPGSYVCACACAYVWHVPLKRRKHIRNSLYEEKSRRKSAGGYDHNVVFQRTSFLCVYTRCKSL
jgi:hypothetical protein